MAMASGAPDESGEVPSQEPIPPSASGHSSASQRFISLDVFRGITILLMLLVNNVALDAATPRQLIHAPWNAGVTLADLVFPWFLLCMGFAIPFAVRSARKKGVVGWRLALRVVTRSSWLFLLGLLVDSSIQRQPIFGIGVLQLLALAYLGGSVLARLPMLYRGIACGVLLLGYGLSLKYLTLTGYPESRFDEELNLVKFLNDTYLSASGWRGLPSVIPTSALVGLGSILGEFLAFGRQERRVKVGVVLLTGVICTGVGFLWDRFLPFNKPVWTPAYILLSLGLGSMLVAILSVMFDHERRKKWAFPLIVFGSNALLAYAGPILFKGFIFQNWTVSKGDSRVTIREAWLTGLKENFGSFNGGLAYTGIYIGTVWVVLYYCYRKGWFLKV